MTCIMVQPSYIWILRMPLTLCCGQRALLCGTSSPLRMCPHSVIFYGTTLASKDLLTPSIPNRFTSYHLCWIIYRRRTVYALTKLCNAMERRYLYQQAALTRCDSPDFWSSLLILRLKVSNAADAIKIACDFVSVDNLRHTQRLAAEFRQHRLTTSTGEDVLQFYATLWHAWTVLSKKWVPGENFVSEPGDQVFSPSSLLCDLTIDNLIV